MTDDPLLSYARTLIGLKDYYALRTVFERGEQPSALQLAQAIGECHTMIGQLIRLHEEWLRVQDAKAVR